MSKTRIFFGQGHQFSISGKYAGADVFERSLMLAPRQGYLGYFNFGFDDDGKDRELNLCFPHMLYPHLGEAVLVWYRVFDEAEERGWGQTVRNGESDRLFEVQERLGAFERNFVSESIAIESLEYFLQTGDQNPNLIWEPITFFDYAQGKLVGG